MDATFFLKGLIIGILIAVPVGPIGVLCIHRTLTQGRIHGLVSGMGAATADAVYGAIAAFGVNIVSAFIIEQQLWFRIIGSIFICCLGARIFFSKAIERAANNSRHGLAGNYSSTFFLTLMNPMILLTFVAVFASLGITSSHYGSGGLLIAGVFTGAGSWWVLISCAACVFYEKMNHINLAGMNRICGTLIMLFGLSILLTLAI
jgi:threonine/homoserine/homoserine lactone efflux protein